MKEKLPQTIEEEDQRDFEIARLALLDMSTTKNTKVKNDNDVKKAIGWAYAKFQQRLNPKGQS